MASGEEVASLGTPGGEEGGRSHRCRAAVSRAGAAADFAGDFRISIELIGAQGQAAARGALDPADLGVVARKPGQKTIWQVTLPQAPRQWQTERIEATTGPVLVTRNQSPYLELRAEGVQFSPGEKPFNTVTASGQLASVGLAAVREARARLAVYDAAGKLVRVVEATPKFTVMPAGSTVAFTVEFWDLDQPPAHVALYFANLR